MVSMDPGIWVTALLSLFIISFVYRDNIFFRFALYTSVGAGMGHFAAVSINTINQLGLQTLLKGDLRFVLGLVFGLSLLSRISYKYSWLSKYGNAVLFGISAGVMGGKAVKTMIIDQIILTILPLNGVPLLTMVSNIISVVAAVTSLSYFLFTIGNKGSLKTSQNIGRLFLIFAVGASLAGRWSWAINATHSLIDLIFKTWLGIL